MRKHILIAAIVIVASSLILWGCQKDNTENRLSTSENSALNTFSTTTQFSVTDAKNWYETNKRTVPNSFNRNEEMVNAATATPDWNFATMVKYERVKDMVVVPIRNDIGMAEFPSTSVVNLIIFKGADNQYKSRLLFFIPTEEYSIRHPQKLSVTDFSGITFQVDDSSRIRLGWAVENGQFTGAINFAGLFNEGKQSQATSRDLPTWLKNLFSIDWWRGVGCFGPTGLDRIALYIKQHPIKLNINTDFNRKPLNRKYDGSDGSNQGDYGTGSVFLEIWGSWIESTNGGNSGGGSGGFKDFFPDGIFGIKNVKNSYDDLCNASTSNANTPFLFAMDNLRQVATNDAQFENAFATTLDYYYQLKALGQNVTFAQVMKDYVINPAKGTSAPQHLMPQLPTLSSNPIFKSKVRSLMQQATSQYSQCANTYGLQASTNNSPIEIPNDAACSCLGDFSVEDALSDMQSTINAVRIKDLKDKYPEYSDIISSFTANPSSDKIDFIMNLLESLKNDKGDTNLPNNGPSLSPGIFVCPSSIQYDNKPDRFNTVGISNLNMTFTLKNGDQIQASTGKLFINIDNDICLNVFVGNCSTHIAKAVEAAYNAVNVYVTNTTPTPTQKQIEDRFALEFGCILYKGFLDVNAIPEGGGRSCDVIRPASTNDKFLTYGTTFNNQLTTSNTPCP